jgi:hypothetical protein
LSDPRHHRDDETLADVGHVAAPDRAETPGAGMFEIQDFSKLKELTIHNPNGHIGQTSMGYRHGPS